MSKIYFLTQLKLDRLRAKVESLNAKARKLGIETLLTLIIVRDLYAKEYKHPLTAVSYYIRGYDVKLVGEAPVINGWRVIARIDHSKAEKNIIQSFNPVPEEYRTAGNDCEHCGCDRNRKYTIVIQNTTTGKYKQVGLTCLADFIRSSEADSIISLYESALNFEDNEDLAEDDPDWLLNTGQRVDFRVDFLLSHILLSIRKDGYISRSKSWGNQPSTSDLIWDSIIDARAEQPTQKDKEAASAMIEAAREILESKDRLNDYEWNLSSIVESEIIDASLVGYLASLPQYMGRLEQDESEYMGEKGEKLTVEVTVESVMPLDSYYGITYLYKFTSQGNVLVWFASREQTFSVGDTTTLKGTVKKHENYNGTKQTVLTRCKAA